MYANSWLYHYYSVQSKIQFGIPYEGAARVNQPDNAYLQQQHDLHGNNLHQQNNHNNHSHHHSPNSLHTPLTHSYLTPQHMSSYGYHSPVPQHQSSPGLVNYYSNTGVQLNYHASNDGYRPYAYRIESASTHPVDYSRQLNHISDQINEPRCNNSTELSNDSSSINSSIKSANQSASNNEVRSPPAKRRASNRLEPIFIPEQNQETLSNDDLIYHASSGDGETVLLTSVLPVRYSHVHLKASVNEPTDLIDQWNPSPPWSETTQKVPDMAQQDLSPYFARTPPTPNSASLTATPSNNGAAFSFDWMPEQFVPVMDSSTHTNYAIPVGMVHETATMMSVPLTANSAWSSVPIAVSSSDAKFLNVHIERSPNDERTRGKYLFIIIFIFSKQSDIL